MIIGFSLYLDLIRFLAALCVFETHFGTADMTGSFLWPLRSLGGPAVTIFFVLSGFVIASATIKPQCTIRSYTIDRTSRIFSVTLPAIAITILLDCIGAALSPSAYAEIDLSFSGILKQTLSAMLFLNESWAGHIPIGSNVPFWSLSFEFWYYVAFGGLMFAKKRWKFPILAFVFILSGPKIILLFPLWLLGVVTYRVCRKLPANLWLGLVCMILTLVGFIASLTLSFMSGTNLPAIPWRHIVDFRVEYAIGAVFAAHLVGVWMLAPWITRLLCPISGLIRWLAGSTLTLYLFHVPILHLLRAISPWSASSWNNRAFLVSGTVASIILLAELTERRRDAWRRAIERLWPLDTGRMERLSTTERGLSVEAAPAVAQTYHV